MTSAPIRSPSAPRTGSFAGSIDGNGGPPPRCEGRRRHADAPPLAGINTIPVQRPSTAARGRQRLDRVIEQLTVNAGGSIGGNGHRPRSRSTAARWPGRLDRHAHDPRRPGLTSRGLHRRGLAHASGSHQCHGTATLAGTVQAGRARQLHRAHVHDLSAAGGRSGTFGSLTTSGLPAGFAAALSYTGTTRS